MYTHSCVNMITTIISTLLITQAALYSCKLNTQNGFGITGNKMVRAFTGGHGQHVLLQKLFIIRLVQQNCLLILTYTNPVITQILQCVGPSWDQMFQDGLRCGFFGNDGVGVCRSILIRDFAVPWSV